MKKLLTEEGFKSAATALGVEVAAIKAVCEVEAPHGGFLDDGRVTILFERHKFHKFSGGIYSAAHSDISNPKAGGYGPAGAHQWVRFSKAFDLDPKAAMKSCSWGKFQIMGFNFHLAGYDDLDSFVNGMKESEDTQLLAFVQFVINTSLADELRRHDWTGFARAYNGADFKINRYDVKLAAAYRKHLGDAVAAPAQNAETVVGHSVIDDLPESQEVKEPEVDPEHGPEPTPKVESEAKGVTSGADLDPAKSEGTPPPAPAVEIKASRPSLKSTAAAILAFILGPLSYLGIDTKQAAQKGAEFAQNNAGLAIKVGVGFAFIVLAYYIWQKAMDRANGRTLKLMDAGADQNKNNLRLT